MDKSIKIRTLRNRMNSTNTNYFFERETTTFFQFCTNGFIKIILIVLHYMYIITFCDFSRTNLVNMFLRHGISCWRFTWWKHLCGTKNYQNTYKYVLKIRINQYIRVTEKITSFTKRNINLENKYQFICDVSFKPIFWHHCMQRCIHEDAFMD